MVEKDEETKFANWVKRNGWRCEKLTGPKGFPDRTAFYKGQVVLFEFKTKTGTPSPHQVEWITWLKSHGFKAYLVRSANEAIQILSELD